MVTLKDIAKEAGVSTVTVSNVVNGKYSKVSKDTLKLVQHLIQKYHYIPNATARSLSSKSSHIIGVILPLSGEKTNLLSSPYDAELIGRIEQYVRQRGYSLMFCCTCDHKEIIATLRMWNVDGAILSGINDVTTQNLLSSLTIPLVFLDSDTRNKNLLSVGSDDYKGGYISTRYLLNYGHQVIAFASPLITCGNNVTSKRFSGYKDALSEKKIPFDSGLVFCGCTTYESGIRLGKEIAKNSRITAVCTTADILAVGIMEGLKISGLNVPADISVVGYDNLPICLYTAPKLTTVAQNITAKIETACSMLFHHMKHTSKTAESAVLDVEIIERGSVRLLS